MVEKFASKYHLEPVKQKKPISDLQKIRSSVKSLSNTNTDIIPKSMEEINKLTNINLARKYLSMKLNMEIKTKKEFCQIYKISPNTLNRGLENIGVKIKKIVKKEDDLEETSVGNNITVLPPKKNNKSKNKENNNPKAGTGNNPAQTLTSNIPPNDEDIRKATERIGMK